VGDSDISIWVGTFDNPFHNHLTLSDSLASSTSLFETNDGGGADRWADFNADGVVGNVLVIAASLMDSSPDDQFKISKLDVCAKAVKFYTVDASADRTFEYSATGRGLADYKLATGSSNMNPRGVATTVVGDKVWVVDGNKKVYRYDANGVLQGYWTANGLTVPEDITTNGTDVWIVDDGYNKVFRYSGGASRTSGGQSAVSSFTLNTANGDAKGIVTDGTHLWVVNDAASGADKVFKYTLTGTLVGSWTIASANGSPTGITLDPGSVNHLWIVDSADDAVYRYNGATSRTSGSQAADHVFQLAGGNGDVQGIADPPPTGTLSNLLATPVTRREEFSLPADSARFLAANLAIADGRSTDHSDSWLSRGHAVLGKRLQGRLAASFWAPASVQERELSQELESARRRPTDDAQAKGMASDVLFETLEESMVDDSVCELLAVGRISL
jgi:hypothetical protein